MSDDATTTTTPPDCARCGAGTYATSRRMKTHDITTGRAIPLERNVPVWRCPRCGPEAPREAE